jgi:hypothetical protein
MAQCKVARVSNLQKNHEKPELVHKIFGLRFEPMTYKTGMRSETHLTTAFDVGSRKERVLDVSFRVATCLVRGRVCVTEMAVWINIHSSSVFVCVCVCVCARARVCVCDRARLWVLSVGIVAVTAGEHVFSLLSEVNVLRHAFPFYDKLSTSTLDSIPASCMEGTRFKFQSRQGLSLMGGLSQFFWVLPLKYRDNEKLTRKVVYVHCMKACRGVEV